MNAVKAALGPWMKIEQSQTYTSGSMQIEGRREENIPASELPVGMQPASASTSSGEPRNLSPTRVPLSIVSPNAGIADMGAAPGMHDGQAYAQPRQAYPQSQAQQTVASQVNVDPLAFYFPSEHEERPRGHRASASVPDIGPHINTPFQPHNGAQAPHAYSATSLMHTSALAAAISPVNTSVHFEATLNGLRDSIVGVAQTTDALRGVVASEARRGEIALANETLRIGEEVMSLRAGVHGLRMQVGSTCFFFRSLWSFRCFSKISGSIFLSFFLVCLLCHGLCLYSWVSLETPRNSGTWHTTYMSTYVHKWGHSPDIRTAYVRELSA